MIRWTESRRDWRRIRRWNQAVLLLRAWPWLAVCAAALGVALPLLGLVGALGAAISIGLCLAAVLAQRFPRKEVRWAIDVDGLRGEWVAGDEREQIAWTAVSGIRRWGPDAVIALAGAGAILVPGGGARLGELHAAWTGGRRDVPPPPAGRARREVAFVVDREALLSFPPHPEGTIRLGGPLLGATGGVLSAIAVIAVALGSDRVQREVALIVIGAMLGFAAALAGLVVNSRVARARTLGDEAGLGAWQMRAFDAGIWLGGPRWAMYAPWDRVTKVWRASAHVAIAFRNGGVRIVPVAALGDAEEFVAWAEDRRTAGGPGAPRIDPPLAATPWDPPPGT